jgi:quinohemoprotein amine dehydrogenase
MKALKTLCRLAFSGTLLVFPCTSPSQTGEGIPVTDALVISKCGSCHPVDGHGTMQRLSWERATPEAWQEVLKRMIREQSVNVTPVEARSIVKYLSTKHGLTPTEAKPVMYYAERRVHQEATSTQDRDQTNLVETCGKCHDAARPLSWRRFSEDWKQFGSEHAARFKFKADESLIAYLAKIAPLTTPEWTSRAEQPHTPALAGKWLVTAHLPGRGNFYGEMTVVAGDTDGEFSTHATLHSAKDGSTLTRTGRNVVYAGSAWRGRSSGDRQEGGEPDDPRSDAREVLWVSADGSQAEGRWYWGQYSEFGFDVRLQRAQDKATVLLVDPPSFKTGSTSNRFRLIGANFSARATPSDVTLGSGVTVRRIVSSTPTELVSEVDVARDAIPGHRDVTCLDFTLPRSLAIYDRVDYIKATPESSMAAFGSDTYMRGFQHYEAIGYQRGPDGKLHTEDDLELGPVEVSWSMEVFYETDASQRNMVGRLSPTGFFTPAAQDPGNNFDVWVVATAKDLTTPDGKPLAGKGYLVVTVPTYTFSGRKYVRELDRWIEEGSSTR